MGLFKSLLVTEQVFVFDSNFSSFLHSVTCNFSGVEIGIVVDAYSAVASDNEEETTDEEQDAKTPAKKWGAISNEEGGGNEDVEVSSASGSLEEKEVILHELEIAE